MNVLGHNKLVYFLNGYIFKLQNNMETRKVYLEIFDMYSVSYSVNVNAWHLATWFYSSFK
jgi:hypothetical protein